MSELSRGLMIGSVAFIATAILYAIQSLFLPMPPAPVLGQIGAALLTAHLITQWLDRRRTRRRTR